MMNRFGLLLLCVPTCVVVAACSSSSTSNNGTASGEVPVDGGAGDAPAEGAPAGGTACTKARDDALVPIDRVSTGVVSVVSESNGVRTLFVDASAGGFDKAIKNPHTYVDLEAGAKVELTDKTAPEAATWDLAMKRDRIFTNSGDGGIGQGGAVRIAKPFASVTAADANAAKPEAEKFFDAECNLQKDMTEGVLTTFSDWYEYDQATHQITGPKPITFVVRGATGKKYKVGIKAYDGGPDGSVGKASGNYLLEVSAL
jgi:hypothetical protein